MPAVLLCMNIFHVDQEEPVSTPCYVAAYSAIAWHIEKNIGRASVAFNIAHGNFAGIVQDSAHCSHGRFDPMLSGINATQVRQGDNQTDRAVAAHSQVAHIIKEDYPRVAGGIGRFAEKRSNHHVGSTRFVDHCGPEGVMLVTKAPQPLGQRATAQVWTSAHHYASRFAPGVGIDHPDSLAFPDHKVQATKRRHAVFATGACGLPRQPILNGAEPVRKARHQRANVLQIPMLTRANFQLVLEAPLSDWGHWPLTTFAAVFNRPAPAATGPTLFTSYKLSFYSARSGEIVSGGSRLPLNQDVLWYKDAIIYQVHVRTFFDSNGDGIGDFQGLEQKLGYLQELGINAIWLMPFFPSPLRDDGYDIADYTTVHSAYGTLDDFRKVLESAHNRGIRVIIEMVLNHTSDQHPWFQESRSSMDNPRRDWYVWSDTDERYKGTRIIFLDTEKSNWAWDPISKAYYWHRFFSHQPDLNYDNPAVREQMWKVMSFWLEMGVDGFRLDAVPYLVEREGTNCENLPETHEVLKDLRRRLDEQFPGRMLLAEANQWPADLRPYFADGNEFHMAFHFPLMPRMFMGLKLEDRKPITEILQQTPEIPPSCQWSLFLRNHDELTLEMVTDMERDYMYDTYAENKTMRLNLGIRRRLAPLLENDRRRIELMNGLLMSLPGTPIIYYGDEIGMGDNINLGDRNGVRTPMQWSGGWNAGFSTVEPDRLYAPLIQNPVYGYPAVNVLSQLESEHSLLRWMQRMIMVRASTAVFGRGSIEFLRPANHRILAYVRRLGNEAVMAVNNLSGAAQAVELDLKKYKGNILIEMSGKNIFPRVSDQPYLLTLGPYQFFWFRLRRI
jgi:maltose alpha-D-glucosyltransferase/alpha-amylase